VGGKALNIHPLAVKDVREIGQRYLAISEELYDRFWEELERAFEIIDLHPEHHHFDRSGKRCSNLKKFPFHILFEERGGSKRILVIRRHRRHPNYGIRRK
jgi:hypothetical protein